MLSNQVPPRFDDFSKIVEIFVKNNAARRTYNVCTGSTIDFVSLAKIINEIDGRNLPINIKEKGIKLPIKPIRKINNKIFIDKFSFKPLNL